MSNPLTKYVAAAGLAGALAFGGYTVAGAQDSGSTTTTQPGATTEAPATPGTAPQGERPDGAAGCDQDQGTDGGGTSGETPSETPNETPAPSTSSSGTATNTAT